MLPTFLIIGSMKCGTTSLYHYFNQHPEVEMSPTKEPGYFILDQRDTRFQGPVSSSYHQTKVNSFEEYKNLFSNESAAIARGEATPHYLYDYHAAHRIKETVPDAKLIAVIRNPVDRLLSNFQHHIRDCIEPLPELEDALAQETQRIQDNWLPGFHYFNAGLYAEQIARYQNLFAKEQLLVCLFEDIVERFEATSRIMCSHIGVDYQDASTELQQSNKKGQRRSIRLQKIVNNVVTHVPAKSTIRRSKSLKRAFNWLNKANMQSTSPPANWSALRHQLLLKYESDIKKTEQLIERDLSHWLV